MRVAIIIDVAEQFQNPAHPSGLTRDAYNTVPTLALGNILSVQQVDDDGLPLDIVPAPVAETTATTTPIPEPVKVPDTAKTPSMGEMA